MPVAIVTGGNKGIGLGVVRICIYLSSSTMCSTPFKVRGLCKQFKGEVYLTARDEARGKVKPPFIRMSNLSPSEGRAIPSLL